MDNCNALAMIIIFLCQMYLTLHCYKRKICRNREFSLKGCQLASIYARSIDGALFESNNFIYYISETTIRFDIYFIETYL